MVRNRRRVECISCQQVILVYVTIAEVMAGKSVISGKSTAAALIRAQTERRILDYSKQSGKFNRTTVRFQGSFCYIDAYENDMSETDEPLHLCRIRYMGDPDRWAFQFYSYAREKYEPSPLLSGAGVGTPEEAFETATLFG